MGMKVVSKADVFEGSYVLSLLEVKLSFADQVRSLGVLLLEKQVGSIARSTS